MRARRMSFFKSATAPPRVAPQNTRASRGRVLRTDFRAQCAAPGAPASDAEECGWFQNLLLAGLAGLAGFSASNFLNTGYTAKEMFDIADANEDGKVSLSEMNKVLDQVQPGTALNNDQWKYLTNYKYYLTQKDFERQPERNAEGHIVRPDPTDHYWELTRREPRKSSPPGTYMSEDKAMIEHKAYMDWSRTEVSLINHVLKHRIAREFYEARKAEPEKAIEDLLKDVLGKLKKQRVQRMQLLGSQRLAPYPVWDAKYVQLRTMYTQGLSRVGLPEEYFAPPLIAPWMLGLCVLFFLQHTLRGEGDRALVETLRRTAHEAVRARDEALRRRGDMQADISSIAEKVAYLVGIKGKRLPDAWRYIETVFKTLKRQADAAEEAVLQCPVCLREFADGRDECIDVDKLIMRGCGHIFCNECAPRLDNCPVCRKAVLCTLDDGIPR